MLRPLLCQMSERWPALPGWGVWGQLDQPDTSTGTPQASVATQAPTSATVPRGVTLRPSTPEPLGSSEVRQLFKEHEGALVEIYLMEVGSGRTLGHFEGILKLVTDRILWTPNRSDAPAAHAYSVGSGVVVFWDDMRAVLERGLGLLELTDQRVRASVRFVQWAETS